MASIISAGTSTGTALNLTGDTSGILQLASNNGTVGLTVDTSQNVGIGTASPSQKLEVSGNILLSNNQYLGIKDTTGASVGFPIYTGSNDAIFGYLASGSTGISTYQFRTGNNTERMRIDSSGNVGIGTNNPTQKLQVQGFIKTGSGGSTGGGLEFPYSSDTASRSWRTKNDEVTFGDYAITQSTTQTGSTYVTQARIDPSGNFQFNSGYGSASTAYGCRAWVNFNGTTASPSTIRGSGNVTSVTKNATGDYTINFTNAMVDANYAVVTACSRDPNGAFTTNIATNDATGGSVPPTTTAVRVTANGGSGIGGKDVTYYSVSVFR